VEQHDVPPVRPATIAAQRPPVVVEIRVDADAARQDRYRDVEAVALFDPRVRRYTAEALGLVVADDGAAALATDSALVRLFDHDALAFLLRALLAFALEAVEAVPLRRRGRLAAAPASALGPVGTWAGTRRSAIAIRVLPPVTILAAIVPAIGVVAIPI